MVRRNWTDEETVGAFALYMMLPISEQDQTNADVQCFAAAIDRTPYAVKLKLANIAANDERRIALGKKGLSNGSRKDAEVWRRFNNEGDKFVDEALTVLMSFYSEAVQGPKTAELFELVEGRSVITYASQRINQDYFRNTLLDSYSSRCCITGISAPKLLVASHIKPWAVSDPKTERLDPSNGLLLNALHDRAFDQGLITVKRDRAGDLRVLVSPKVKRGSDSVRASLDSINIELSWLWSFNGALVEPPLHHAPTKEYLEYHQENIFLSA